MCESTTTKTTTKHGDAVQKALQEGRRPLPSQDHRRKSLSTHQKLKQARPHVVGMDSVRLQRDREQFVPHLEPKNTSRGEEQERRYHRKTTKSGSRDQAALAATSSCVTVVRFQRRHARRQLRAARRYAAGRAELHHTGFRRRHVCRNGRVASASTNLTGVTSPGGASPAGILPGGVTPKGSSPPPAPTHASAAPRSTNGRANRGTVGVTLTVTRSRVASVLPVPVATRYGGGRNNIRATSRSTIGGVGDVANLSPFSKGTARK